MGLLLFLASTLMVAVGTLPWLLDDLEIGRDTQSEFRDGWGAWETLPAVALLWFTVMNGINWLLVATRAFSAAGLWVAIGICLSLGAWLLWRRSFRLNQTGKALAVDPMVALVLVLFMLASAYLILRGSVSLIVEFDAVSYHFPKAVEIVKSGTIDYIESGDFRLSYFPWNYELLLADCLALTGGDRHAYLFGLISTFAYCALLYATFRRAWPEVGGTEGMLALLAVAATPVILMHADAYKNDVMFTFFLWSFAHWAARWDRTGGRGALILALLGLGLAFGTKVSAVFMVPVLVWLAFVHRGRLSSRTGEGWGNRARSAALLLGIGALCGALWPLLNLVWSGHPLGDAITVGGIPAYESNAVPRYTGFSNLWRFPVLLFTRPFSPNTEGVWVFWEQRYWFWPAYRSMYGHFGWVCSVLLLLIPLGWRHHRRGPGAERRFRTVLSLALLAFTLLSLPQRYRVDGMFCGFPRYLLFLPALVALWTLAPLLGRLRATSKRGWIQTVGLGLAVYFGYQSVDYFANDESKSLDRVLLLLTHPERRLAGGVERAIDRVAGPRDAIAFDSGFGGMSYPLYGKGFTRSVTYLKVTEGQFVAIPPGVEWVVIDRAWNVGWSHPGVTNAGDFWLPIKPAPSREDMTLLEQLARDPAFTLVYRDPSRNETAFRRKQPQPTLASP